MPETPTTRKTYRSEPGSKIARGQPFASTAVCLLELIGRALRRVTPDGVISVPDFLAHDTDVGGGLDAQANLTRPGGQNRDRYVQFGEEDAFVRSAGQNKHLRSPFRQLTGGFPRPAQEKRWKVMGLTAHHQAGLSNAENQWQPFLTRPRLPGENCLPSHHRKQHVNLCKSAAAVKRILSFSTISFSTTT
jgi:hypothetical protein